MKLSNKKILIISPEPWDSIFVSKHHYSIELAKRGNQVFFLNPPLDSCKGVNKNKIDAIEVLDYSVFMKGSNQMPPKLRRIVQNFDIRKIKRTIGEIDVVWSFDPFRFQFLKDWKPKLAIYHPVDLHNTPMEICIAEHADVVFSVSDRLLDKFRALKIPVGFINHGLSMHFVEATQKHECKLPGNFSFKIGLVGNILYRFMDTEALTRLVERFPNIGFYFIGPSSPKSSEDPKAIWLKELSMKPNVFLMGKKPSNKLPLIYKELNAFLIPYLGKKHLLELSNSHKVLEYLSSGKPVVCSYIDQYTNTNLLLMADDNEELESLFKKLIDQYPEFMKEDLVSQRIAYAKAHTYGRQIEKIEQFVADHCSL